MNYIKDTINLNEGDVELKRKQIRQYFLQTYELDERLFDLLKNKEKNIYEQPNNLRHPLIFYYGHTASFFINKLFISGIIPHRINKEFESIFAIGVDEMSWDDLESKHYSWPSFKQTKAYRDEVKKLVLHLIDTIEFQMPINWDSPMWVVMMCIEHENIHIETSSVLLRELDLKFLKPDEIFTYKFKGKNEYPKNELLDVSGGKVELVKDRQNPIFYGWDNEFSYHLDKVESFKASKYLVSNGEFLEFINDGGYEKGEYFSKHGQKWLNFAKPKYPRFWVKKKNEYFLREINKLVPLPLDFPVDVNAYEAEAFCKYKSKKLGFDVRLPSEDEYYRLYEFTNADTNNANIGLKSFNQSPVDEFRFGDFYDIVGNVWQWSITPMYPFDDFKTHVSYDDFTTPTFDDKHSLMKGGSFISLGNEVLKSARYAFRKHFFQHAGFRYVSSNQMPRTKYNKNIYESDELISQYCEFHYGDEYFGVENFLSNCVNQIKPFIKHSKKALDLGCSVGRASFELAHIFDEVLGIDFSANFINVGVKLKNFENLTYKVKVEGDIFDEKSISLSSLGFENVKQKVSFMQGDACNLKPLYSGYDLIFCSNLIDRLYYPQKFLDDVPKRINKGGLLVITSPYTWLEEYTPRKNWLGGFVKDGKNVHTIEHLKSTLSDFKLLKLQDVPFVLKETNRKFQHTLSQMSIWQKL